MSMTTDEQAPNQFNSLWYSVLFTTLHVNLPVRFAPLLFQSLALMILLSALELRMIICCMSRHVRFLLNEKRIYNLFPSLVSCHKFSRDSLKCIIKGWRMTWPVQNQGKSHFTQLSHITYDPAPSALIDCLHLVEVENTDYKLTAGFWANAELFPFLWLFLTAFRFQYLLIFI